jgi:hypothetical protein
MNAALVEGIVDFRVWVLFSEFSNVRRLIISKFKNRCA